jgi:hypothetical protein
MATFTAATVIANSRTPLSVAIQVANVGGVDAPVFSYTRTNLLAALLPGPLKAKLARTVDWSVLNIITGTETQDDFIRISKLEGGMQVSLVPPTYTVTVVFVADALNFGIERDNEGPVACDLLVELRLEHSNER